MASAERGPATILRTAPPHGAQTEMSRALTGNEVLLPDSSQSFYGQGFSQILGNSAKGARGVDTAPDRGAVFPLGGLDQKGLAIGAGQHRYYLMIGEGASTVLHTWVVIDSPDYSAIQYAGGDTPLSNIHISGSWVK